MKLRPVFILPAILTFALGVGVVFYRGPGWHAIRTLGGDVLASAEVYFFASIFWSAPWRRRFVGCALICLTVELIQLGQWVGPESPQWMHLLLGSTFDPFDLLAYLIGLVIAVGIEKRFIR
ncbi:MAG: DUF2809 domain-containing protein [Bradymonadia bacterium]